MKVPGALDLIPWLFGEGSWLPGFSSRFPELGSYGCLVKFLGCLDLVPGVLGLLPWCVTSPLNFGTSGWGKDKLAANRLLAEHILSSSCLRFSVYSGSLLVNVPGVIVGGLGLSYGADCALYTVAG